MKKTVTALCFATLALWPETASAKSLFAKEFGPARPPIGFVQFCANNPTECRDVTYPEKKIVLDKDRTELIDQVNTYVNDKIIAAEDIQIYGEKEFWTYPVEKGDCEDYALLKRKYLLGLGFPQSALLVTVVIDETGEVHAVLLVHTDKGDFALDNRRDNILRWDKTKYKFLKRQSTWNVREWVSLVKVGFVDSSSSD